MTKTLSGARLMSMAIALGGVETALRIEKMMGTQSGQMQPGAGKLRTGLGKPHQGSKEMARRRKQMGKAP